MSATIQAGPPVSSSSAISERTLLLGLGLTSFAALLLELALTRLFSVVLFYHFAFLAISIALLGVGAVVLGVSRDPAESHKAFAEHHKLPFHLVSDPNGDFAKKFGVGSTLGFTQRQSFVIGADGNIKKIYRSVDVTVHAQQIQDDLKS